MPGRRVNQALARIRGRTRRADSPVWLTYIRTGLLGLAILILAGALRYCDATITPQAIRAPALPAGSLL